MEIFLSACHNTVSWLFRLPGLKYYHRRIILALKVRLKKKKREKHWKKNVFANIQEKGNYKVYNNYLLLTWDIFSENWGGQRKKKKNTQGKKIYLCKSFKGVVSFKSLMVLLHIPSS